MTRISHSVHALAATAALLLPLSPAVAQEHTADEILSHMTAAAEATEDATFVLTGRLIDADGTSIALEIDLEVIPDAEVARATFHQPDALADNIVVFSDDAVYNYLFLTNQVTIFAADDPDALGGFLGEAEDESSFFLTLDLEELFAGWEVEVVGYEEGEYRLRFSNIDVAASLREALVRVEEGTWVPGELILIEADGRTLAELFVADYRPDTGLTVEDVTWLPEDAEVIDERD